MSTYHVRGTGDSEINRTSFLALRNNLDICVLRGSSLETFVLSLWQIFCQATPSPSGSHSWPCWDSLTEASHVQTLFCCYLSVGTTLALLYFWSRCQFIVFYILVLELVSWYFLLFYLFQWNFFFIEHSCNTSFKILICQFQHLGFFGLVCTDYLFFLRLGHTFSFFYINDFKLSAGHCLILKRLCILFYSPKEFWCFCFCRQLIWLDSKLQTLVHKKL